MVAFNEQVLLGRVRAGELKPGCIILLESMWRTDRNAKIVESYVAAHDQLVKAGYRVYEVPLERECRILVKDPHRGKNMFRARHAVLDLQPRPRARPRADRHHLRQEGQQGHRVQYRPAGSRICVGGGQSRHQVRDPRRPGDGAARGHERQYRDRASASSPRAWTSAPCIRSRRRPRRRIISPTASSGSAAWSTRRKTENRRLRVRDRRLVCEPVHGDDHLGAGPFAQAGGDRSRRDGGDPAGRHRCPARRPVDRPAHQAGAGRPVRRHVRQSRRRPQDRDGDVDHRGLLLFGDHLPASSPRHSTWW